MEDHFEFEVINMAPKVLPVTNENGVVTVDLTGYEPLTPTEFPIFSEIPGLQDLRFFSNYLKEIPAGFCELQRLRMLFMSCSPIKPDNGLLRLPEQFSSFSDLEELHLVGNHFEGFPVPLCQLNQIRKLYMDNCTLSKIPKEIKNMSSLVVVDFSYNNLGNPDSLPKEFFDLPNLKDLYLIDCQLTELPPEIANLKSLERLRVGKNSLSKLPEELYDLTNLRKLNAERNEISELSPRIGQLHHLTLLLMMENKLTTLPDEIKDLESCIHINVFDNKLTCLPQAIIEMPVLESLIVDANNNLRSPPLDVCTRGLDSIKGYFESLAAVDTQAVHSQRLKVVLLGEAGAGKSSLGYALKHAKALAYPDSEPHSTVGVDFYTWQPIPGGVEFHIVDCAGQRCYQLTHPFFLSSEALHILVVDLFNYEKTETWFSRTVGDWLDLVTSRILKPRIMIVPTHLDKFEASDESSVQGRCEDILDRVQHYSKTQKALIEREISEKNKKGLKNPLQGGSDPEWKKTNPPIISSTLVSTALPGQTCVMRDNDSYIAMVPVSSIRELKGVKGLQDEIIRVAEDCQLFPSVGRDLPEDWITLEKEIKRRREEDCVRCMPYAEFETFAIECTGLSPMGVKSAVTYLDSIGELQYYNSIPSPYNMFIDLKWLAKLVKCLFRHDLEKTLTFDENYLTYDVLPGYFEELKKKLLKEAVLSQDLLRCLWDEIDLDDDMFPQMVELLHHLGLACQLPSDGSGEQNLFVPWFLNEYSDAVEAMLQSLPGDQEEINLLFMMAYMPPGLFDRLRVRCCSLNFDYYNWKNHVLLFTDDYRVVIRKDKYSSGTDASSPAIYIKGRGPKACLETLWELLLQLVQETDALLKEWQRLTVKRFSLCPLCAQKGKPKPCLFPCNWLSSSTPRMRGSKTKMCQGTLLWKGSKFDASLIYPPPDVVKRLLDAPPGSEPETEKLPRVIPFKINNASAAGNDNGSNICYNQSEKKLQVREDNFEGNSAEHSTVRNPRAEDVLEIPSFSSLSLERGKPEFSHSGPLTAEGSIKNKSTWKDKVTYSNIVTSEGGVVVGEGVKLVCPRGAVDDPKTIKITLEDSSKYYGLLVQRDLENDVMFGSPIIHLKPNGHVFKKPVRLTAKLKLKNFHSDEVFILHCTEARDGKIIWQDITHNSKMDEKNAEVTMEIDHFSVITALIRLQKMTAILTKDIVYRLNVLPFNYTISVLINKNSLREELALLFVSQDVYSEQFYQEQETSALVQLKAEGFRELHVRSLDGEGEKRVYNGEDLKVSVHLGKDYHLAESRQESFDFTVHSSVWWNTGEVFRLPLEWTEDVRILCGTVSVQGGYGHRCVRHVYEMDLCGYVRNVLGVKRVIFNLMPIAHLVNMHEELMTLVKKSRKEEDEQLEMILQHWLKENDGVKDIATLRKDLEMLKPEGYKVTQRGQMHIRQLRELATKISGSQGENADLMKYFCVQIQALCKKVLRDCCMELEDSEEGIQRATLSTNHVGYLENRRIISKDIARKYRQVCSSTEDTQESISETFLSIVPHFIQNVKEVFAYERVLEVQNGLKGLCEETLKQSLSDAREAEQSVRIIRLLGVVCEILEQLCHENCGKEPPAEINAWGETVAILSMLNFLKPFFLHCPQDIRLHKRLELFSRRLKYIMSDQEDTADDVFMRDFSDVSLSLIHFARFSPSKLVRFELTASTNSPVSCVGENNNENVQYDRYQQTYSQWFEISKESEDELQLHASAFVHVNGRICKKGAFQSVVIIKASAEEAFDGCMVDVTGVAADKVKEEDTDNLRVVLCSTLRKKVIEALDVLKRKLSEEVVDFRRSEVTQCHLTIQSVTSEAKRVVALRLFYKWGSEALSLDSKDFVCFADSSADGACIPAEKFVGFGDQLVPMDTAPLLATNAADLGALDQFRRDGRIQCETTGLEDQLTPEQAALSLVTPTVASTNLGTIDQLQRHGRILCGKIEYHVHQHVNHMKGNVCVVGDKPKLNVSTLNDQMPSQCALPQGPSCAPHRSIADGKRSQESPRTPPNTGT